MPRYIDVDRLIAHLNDEIEGCEKPFGSRANGKSIAYGTMLGLRSAISFAETLATADVAPKSEVERLTIELEAMRTAANSYKMHYENLAREIFQEIERHMATNNADLSIIKASTFAELKKKYTEEEK